MVFEGKPPVPMVYPIRKKARAYHEQHQQNSHKQLRFIYLGLGFYVIHIFFIKKKSLEIYFYSKISWIFIILKNIKNGGKTKFN